MGTVWGSQKLLSSMTMGIKAICPNSIQGSQLFYSPLGRTRQEKTDDEWLRLCNWLTK